MREDRRVPVRDGLSLRVHLRGEGDPAVLLHGFTGSVEAWGEEVLDGLARRRRVVALSGTREVGRAGPSRALRHVRGGA